MAKAETIHAKQRSLAPRKGKDIGHFGLIPAAVIFLSWFALLSFSFSQELKLTQIWTIVILFIQTHLFTGLFITAHDAMHGTVSSNKILNHAVGQFATFLYAFFPYNKLYTKHHLHHSEVATEHDPDYHEGGFIAWYASFLGEYISWWQLLGYALTFNLLKLWIPTETLVVFWIVPALLSTIQLFYFGTYLPHKGSHNNRHHARSQAPNHFLAFLSCYFFGYHYEHHDKPWVPWWRLYKER